MPRKVRKKGRVLLWLCGGALGLNLLLVVGLVGLLAWNGMGFFWPATLQRIELEDGRELLAQVLDEEVVDVEAEDGSKSERTSLRLKIGNRDLYGLDFEWVDAAAVVRRKADPEAVALERWQDGDFYGYLVSLQRGDQLLAEEPEELWISLQAMLVGKNAEREALERLDERGIADVNDAMVRLGQRRENTADPDRRASIEAELAELQERYEELSSRLFRMRERYEAESLTCRTADGREVEIRLSDVVRATRPNAMGTLAKLGLYFERVGEFLTEDPRNSNTEGGIFPAIFGTVLMVFLMSIAAVPLGVLAALYLREYAKQGPIVRLVRIAVNNLAGVPSIVFGVFGLGFFVYGVGGAIDSWFYEDTLPRATFGTGGILWASLTLALLTVPVVIVASEEGLAAVPRAMREGSLALGATKFETIRRVVIPAAAPGIMTGMILAVARAAGEVAPLMIVGMVKTASSLPMDHHAPYVHLERKFMHLGYHVFDLAFQSPNVEAARPMVFASALFLVLLVIAMNLVATMIRNHLRRKGATSAV